MKYIKYTTGFILGVAFVWLVGSLVAWSPNPGKWDSFWRFWCMCWAMVWGHFGGLIVKERGEKHPVRVIR